MSWKQNMTDAGFRYVVMQTPVNYVLRRLLFALAAHVEFRLSFIWPQNFLIGFVVAFPQLRWVLCV